jgi:hypothetical protein
VGITMDQDITIKFSLNSGKCLKITPWSNLMSMNQSNFLVSNIDNFGLWEWGKVIKLSSNSVHLWLGWCEWFKPFLGLNKSKYHVRLNAKFIQFLPLCIRCFLGRERTAFCLAKGAPWMHQWFPKIFVEYEDLQLWEQTINK